MSKIDFCSQERALTLGSHALILTLSVEMGTKHNILLFDSTVRFVGSSAHRRIFHPFDLPRELTCL